MRDRNVFDQCLPAVRRRSLTTLDKLLKNTIAQSFLSYISGIKDHKKSLKESEEAISSHFKKINSIIAMVDQHISRRMESHQNELFAVVKGQIQAMRQQTKQIVERMNTTIAQKNTQDQIWRLNNQLDYFKAQTLSIFNQNKKMKEEIINLTQSLRQAQIQLENNDALMQKLKKKYMRENMTKQKIITFINSNIKDKPTVEQINQIANSKPQIKMKFITQRSLQTRLKHVQPGIVFQSSDFDLLDLNQFQSAKKTSQQMTNNSPKYLDEHFFLNTNDKATQTEQFTPSKQKASKLLTLRHFSNSNTSSLQITYPQKKISVIKNGFSLRTEIKKANQILIENALTYKLGSQSKNHSRYMSIALNKNKVGRTNNSFKNKSTQQF